MSHQINGWTLSLHVISSAALVGCLDPTQATLDISTDSPCIYGVHTGISAGLLTDIEALPYDTTTSICKDGGEIGSLVLVPPENAEKNSPFAFKVVASLGAPLESCVAPNYGPQCIVARRAMRFVPQRPFRVPVLLSQACAGVACPENQTCVEGTCRSVTVDPDNCIDGTTCVPDAVDIPPWQLPIAGPGLHIAHEVAVGADGAVVLAGSFGSSVQVGGETFTSKGDVDTFIAAYSPTGAHKWSRAFGGPGLDEIVRVAIGPDGSINMLVWFQDSVDFGGGLLSSAGRYDAAIVKYTAYGKLEWALPIGGLGDEVPSSIAVDSQGNLFVVGMYDQPFAMEKQTLAFNGGTDIFLLSVTRTGKLRYAKTIGGSMSDGPSGIATDAAGNVFVSGYFSGTMNPTGEKTALTAVGGNDAFLASYDASGEFRWIKTLTSKGNHDRLMDVAVRGDRVVVTGEIASEGKLDTLPVGAAGQYGLVATFNTTGTLEWAKTFASGKQGAGQDVTIAADGSIVLGGHTHSSSVFDSESATPTGGSSNAFVAVLEVDGTPRWAKVFGSSEHAYMLSVAASPDHFVYAAGWFVTDFNNGVEVWTGPSQLDEEGFFLRIAPP